MSNNIDLKKGLNIPVSGCAELKVSKTVVPDVIAIKPSDFKGFNSRLLVKEGDRVLAGSPVLSDKNHPDVLVTSPVSGTVAQIVRGEKRKLLSILVNVDATQEYCDFGAKRVETLSADDVRKALLESGLWVSLIQRPYGIIANPETSPKAIFVSAFNTAPLAVDNEWAFTPEFDAIQNGISALSKIANVHVSLNAKNFSASVFHKLEKCTLHSINSTKHPAGNVGVQISHISPIRKDEIVWTVSMQMIAAIGKLFSTGKLCCTRKVAITGPEAVNPEYIETVPGMAISAIKGYFGDAEGKRIVSGDILTGETIGPDGFLGFYDNQVTILKEGTETELFGWAKPFRFNQFSATRSYFSRLLPKKRYDMDTNLHGGMRAFVMSDSYYADVLPMDIYPLYLIKACLAGDIDKMEKFGIYEVLPEDFALCEYIDPSKNYIQEIIRSGIDLMIKEMA